jgi:hypothetical protein
MIILLVLRVCLLSIGVLRVSELPTVIPEAGVSMGLTTLGLIMGLLGRTRIVRMTQIRVTIAFANLRLEPGLAVGRMRSY